MSKNTKDTKGQILLAALEVVSQSGTAALTLEAVAEEAGFSKGGLLYNFPTKDALIRGMVEFLAGKFEAEIATARDVNRASKSPTLAAMVDVTEGWLRQQRDVARAILPATADKPDLRQPFIDVKLRLRAAILEETGDLGAAFAIWTSLEGLHFSEAHCVSTLTDDDRAAVFSELRARLAELNK
ncbi:TetR/AcrR family transcriptional regulator [Roseibium sp.]|uniref:TetR/AcrR family transcriptional regulator n=1 Tax=Roseibium sp. TaxID=1936156 RepID=UPI003B522F35